MPAPGALVFPVLSYGYSPHHLGRPGTVSLSLEGVLGQVREAVGCLLASGFPRVALVNGHGGNSALLRAAVSDMACRGAPVTSVDYWEPSRARWSGLLRGRFASVGHACEFETALRMALEGPEAAAAIAARAAGLPPRLDQPFVAPGGIDGFTPAGAVAPPIFGAQDCGYYGDPAAARRETGAALLPVLAEGLAGFLTWFAGADLVLGRR
jgi:creatinine amidohydrolase